MLRVNISEGVVMKCNTKTNINNYCFDNTLMVYSVHGKSNCTDSKKRELRKNVLFVLAELFGLVEPVEFNVIIVSNINISTLELSCYGRN